MHVDRINDVYEYGMVWYGNKYHFTLSFLFSDSGLSITNLLTYEETWKNPRIFDFYRGCICHLFRTYY